MKVMEHKDNMDEKCSQHPNQPLNNFCEDCDTLICIRCRVSAHESHKLLTLSQKCKDLKRKLDRYQRDRNILEWQRNNLESCTEKVKQTIHRQYCNIKNWLFEAYQRHISEIDNMVNVELQKYVQRNDHFEQVTELLLNYSHSSSFLLKSKDALEKIKAGLSTQEITWSKPKYVSPKEQFLRFSDDFLTLSKDLFGQCRFCTKEMNTDTFESPPRKTVRSQSLVEIPTFTIPPQRPPSELLRSVSGSMSSLPLSFHTFSANRTMTGEELQTRDKSSSEDIFEDARDDMEELPPLVNTVMEFIRRMVRIVTLVKGEASVIKAENSEVKLHVPAGIHGAILANVHTNHARFIHHVPHNDCLVAPICEYHLQQPYQEQTLCEKYGFPIPPAPPSDNKYKIEIPHIVKEVDKARSHIRIHHGNLHSGVPSLQKHSTKHRKSNISFDIDKDFVTIETNHFSGYLVTTEGINCCGQSAFAHMFGSLVNIPKAKPLATVKIYLSSIHGKIKDYEFDLKRREQDCEKPLSLIQSNEISLSTETYDASKSEMKLVLKPEKDHIWKGYNDESMLDHVKPLNKVLKYSNGHICKLNPTEVTVFYLEASKPLQEHLRVGLKIAMTIAEVNRQTNAFLRWLLNDNIRYIESSYYHVLDLHDNHQPTASVFYGKMKELTDLGVLNLSRRLHEKDDIRRLANVLDMTAYQVDRHLNNNPKLSEAVHGLLIEWRNTQKNNLVAHTNICNALQRAGMQLLINELY